MGISDKHDPLSHPDNSTNGSFPVFNLNQLHNLTSYIVCAFRA